jgi:sugar phosphate isomerase/epimerase
MQLGISTYSFPWSVGIKNFIPPHPFSANDLLLYAADRNIGFVQFGDNYPLHLLTDHELIDLKHKADELKIKLQPGARKLTVENILTYISIAKAIDADFIRIIIDDEDYQPTEDKVVEIIKDLLPYLQKANLVLAIENHDRFPAQTLKDIVEKTDDQWIGICLDTANSFGAGEGLKEVVSILARYTINLHIKDFSIHRLDHKMGFRVNGCIAGSGMLNIPLLVNEVRNYGRCATATLEVWSDPEQTIDETILKEQSWVQKSIEYLKTVLS